MLLHWGQLLLGAVVLYLGAEWLVKGAAGLARAAGVRPLLIGLTVVAYGTSAPELTVGIASAVEGHGAIAFGNSVGSNIANLGLILGMTALIAPPMVDGALIRREVPLLLLSTAVLPVLLLDGTIGRLEGGGLVAVAVAYSLVAVRAGRRAGPDTDAAAGAAVFEQAAEAAGAPAGQKTGKLIAITLVGLVLLVGGGKLLVDGAVAVARDAGMSERVVGLTIVAIGTSLPELAASLVAALRGHADLAVGNVVGSNLFNVLLILGIAGLTRPLGIELGTVVLDLAVLGGMTLFAALLLRSARRLTRVEGALLLLFYVAFLLTLLFTG